MDLLCLLVGALLFGILLGEKRDSPQLEVYTLTMELESAELLEILNSILRGFSLNVVDKSLVRHQDVIYFTVVHRSTPLIQHLFFKRLANLEGVGQIKVC